MKNRNQQAVAVIKVTVYQIQGKLLFYENSKNTQFLKTCCYDAKVV